MKHQRTQLNALQARARAAASRSTHARVVVVPGPVAAEPVDGEDAPPAAPTTAELWLYGTVGGYWWGFDSDDVATALRAMGDVEQITVRLHSFGGSAIEGIAIANLLANHPAEVLIVVDGLAASAASMIALAGKTLVMSPGSQLMVHDAWMCVCGNAAELRAEAEWIDKQSNNYAETYAHRAGGTRESWRATMLANDGDGTWYSAQEAVDAGLADRVANIASTTPPPPVPDLADLDDDVDAAAAAEWDFEVLTHPAARAAWSASARGGWATERRSRTPKPPAASADGSTTQHQEAAMAFSAEQLTNMRAKLGLPADADETAISNAVNAVVEESLEETPPARQQTPGALTLPEGFSLVSDDVLEGMRTGAAAGVAARTQQLVEHRDRTINAAVAAGKITPARAEHFQALWAADADGTEQLLGQLAPGLVPVEERGHAQTPAEGDAPAVNDAVMAGFAAQFGLTKEDLSV